MKHKSTGNSYIILFEIKNKYFQCNQLFLQIFNGNISFPLLKLIAIIEPNSVHTLIILSKTSIYLAIIYVTEQNSLKEIFFVKKESVSHNWYCCQK